MIDHPETKGNEVCVGNTSNKDKLKQLGLKSARLGKQAYCIAGKKLHDCLPLFICKHELHLYNQFMEEQKKALLRKI